MVLLAEVAERHRAARERLTKRAVSSVLREWQQFDVRDLDLSWDLRAETMVAAVASAQTAAAAQANPYMAAVARASGEKVEAQVAPAAFSGVTLDSRELGPAMYGAVTHTKDLIGTGRSVADAFTVGASFLATVVSSAIQDMGRQADLTAGVGARRTRYVRVISPGACSRCAILAGAGSSAKAYLRHPSCKCTALPVDGVPEGMFASPKDYFESLSASEQERVFTKAGAEAIRHGADPIKVVNARRGAYGIGYSGHYGTFISESRMRRLQAVTVGVKPDGSPLQVFMTTEGTTSRGAFGRREIAEFENAKKSGRYRRTTTIRLMPEQIAVMAGGDTDRWIELLQRYGYLY